MKHLASTFLALTAALITARAATYTVTTPPDSGAGSLRRAILDASINAGLDFAAGMIAGKLRSLLHRPPGGALLLEGSDDLPTWTSIHTIPLTKPGPMIDVPITIQRRFFSASP